jgi:hypothetical protein
LRVGATVEQLGSGDAVARLDLDDRELRHATSIASRPMEQSCSK